MPEKPHSFWKELKRRKVVRVLTVYAATAFVIIELINNITEPLRLPEWVPTLVIVLLAIGLLISIVISWVYDIHPERGIVKTESADKVRAEDIPQSSKSWKIASYISFVVIVGLIVLNIFPRSGKKDILDKSIAVLPFKNDSPDQERMYFINGTMEAILDNLCKIEDLRVPGRTSIEQYRDNPKPIPTIAKELNVSYILEGSGHRDGNNVRLNVQLLDGKKDQHLWSKAYDANIEDIFSMQSEIAQLIAAEIEAVITPEELLLIEKIPTTSLTAFDFYQRGREEYLNGNIERAENLYHDALKYDSTFAQAYTGLANVYSRKYYILEYYSEEFLDSALTLADIALSYNDHLAEAYTIRGRYYYETGNPELAIQEYDKALKINPNYWETYYGKGMVYWNNDLLETINNFQKAASLNHGSELPNLLRRISLAYVWAGFKDKGNYYSLEALKLDGDSVSYLLNLTISECWNRNFNKAIEYGEKALIIDTTNIEVLFRLGSSYSYSGQHTESFKYLKKLGEILESSPEKSINPGSEHRIGYAYWKNGYKNEAEYFLNKALENSYLQVKLSRRMSVQLLSYYDIAAGHAFRDERDKAYENLKIFNQKQIMPLWAVTLIKIDPLFDSIRHEPEFQQIARDIEAKYQAEHDRVRKWLDENDML